MSRKFLVVANVLAGCLCGIAAMNGAWAADHRDAPALVTGIGDVTSEIRKLDINDVYVFTSPQNARNTVLIMTVNPLSIPGNQETFSSTGSYDLNVDTDGDAIEDLTYTIEFKPVRRGTQKFSVTETRRRSVVLTRTAETGKNKTLSNGIKVTAGTFDDPFFFDLDAFKAVDADGVGGEPAREFNDAFANDFFAGFNVTAIVMEIPNRLFRSDTIAVWAATNNHHGLQIDRMGFPAINTVLIRPNRFFNPGGNFKNAFNAGHPFFDRNSFGEEVRSALLSFVPSRTDAADIANILLPDMMPFELGNANGFLNGRRLADDVIDAELNIVTAGGLTTDSVPANDKTFRDAFPYIATPHAAP